MKPLLQMPDPGQYELITDSDALQSFCDSISRCRWIAIDTEFQRERTWFPKLCLLQVATAETTACIDPLAIEDIGPILDIIYDPNVAKILHSARQDLEVFHTLRQELPGPIFDTQIAAALLGFGAQTGYAALVRELLGVELDKAHTRSDWERRPLSPAQLKYAAEDVSWLARIYPVLLDRLTASGRLEWLHEEAVALTDKTAYDMDPAFAWQRIRGAQRLAGPSFSVLCALAEWRDRTAKSENLPRNWLLRDAALLAIASNPPRDKGDLENVADLHPSTLRRHGNNIIPLVKEALQNQAPAQNNQAPPTPEQKQLIGSLQKKLHDIAERENIDTTLIAPRKELVRLVMGEDDLSIMRGWRYQVAGRQLESMLSRPE